MMDKSVPRGGALGGGVGNYLERAAERAEVNVNALVAARYEASAGVTRAAPGSGYVPSPDQLLMLFQQASVAHQNVAQSLGRQMQDAINCKNGVTEINNAVNALVLDKDGKADATEIVRMIDDLASRTNNPDVKAGLAEARAIATNGDFDKDDKSKLDQVLSGITQTVDDQMQVKSMHLKQENDYFASITAVIKEIMDGNSKVFNTIMGR